MKIREPNTGDIGASKELLVCADFLKHGYEVFRAVNGTASVDLIVLLGRNLYRVEVKSRSTKATFYSHSGKADILAVVNEDNSIEYFSIPGWKKFDLELRNIYNHENRETMKQEKNASREETFNSVG